MSAQAAAAPPVGKHSSIPRPALILHCYMLVGHLNDAFLLFSLKFSCTQPSLFAGGKILMKKVTMKAGNDRQVSTTPTKADLDKTQSL